MKITYYCAMSADEYIATETGGVEWLDAIEMDESESSYETFFASVDGLVMGRGTYDFIYDYGSWPYGDVPSWVLTGRPFEALPGANIRVVHSLDDFLQEAGEKGLQHIWLVGGGELASAFLDRGLITDLSITVMDTELGSGVPLFSRHELKDIQAIDLQCRQKKGYKQLEIQVAGA